MARIHVHESPLSDASWNMRDSAPRFQPVSTRKDGSTRYSYAGSATLDPFPAYPHERLAVTRAVRHVQRCFRPDWDVHLYMLDREEVGRSNGYSTIDFDHYAPDRKEGQPAPRHGVIVLSGKRIPPHPHLTEYLVAHEYGHNVEWMLEARRDPETVQKGKIIAEYAELRGLSNHHGDGGRWHNSATEVFACDFRLLVCGVQPDFWPHHGVARPERLVRIRRWWENELGQELAAA